MAALNPQTVLANSNCYACFGASLADLFLLSLWDSISQSESASPYDGLLVYTREGLGTTTIVNPVGDYDLTFGANKVTEVHCHNCPLITEFYLSASDVLTTVDFDDCPALNTFYITECNALTSLDLRFIQTADQITLGDCLLLASVNLNGLVTVSALEIYNCAITSASFPALTSSSNLFFVYDNPYLASISLPVFATANGISFRTNPSLPSLSLPSLTFVSNGVDVSDCATQTSVSFPVLTQANPLITHDCPLLTSISAPLLQVLIAYSGGNCSSLVSIQMPSADEGWLTSFLSNTCPLLTNISLSGAGAFPDGIDFQAINANLNQATVDYVLARGVAGAIASNIINLSGGTSSTPSAGGLANKATLIGNGVAVTTN